MTHEADTIKFEKLEEQHFHLLQKWLNMPHVKKWWDQDIQWNYELIQNKYNSYIEEYKLINGQRKVIHPYIISANSKHVGYIQLYNIHDFHSLPELKDFPDPLASIDIYIGEPAYLNKGIGTRALRDFITHHAAKMSNTVFVAADKDNTAAIKMYRACGFKEVKLVENEIWMLRNLMDVPKIHCQEPWFSKIRSGIKTVEGRKFNIKYSNLRCGDLLEFYCDDESFLTEVVAVKVYNSLEEYLEKEGYQNVLPGVISFEEAVNVYLKYNSPYELQIAGGFLGIHIKIHK